MTQHTLPELLAPAGSVAALHAGVRAGADAVYLGMGAFNARRNAENFNEENIRQVCDYAHLRGVNVYVTMNTIVLPGEMRDALDCAACAYDAGADAFIVQDIGLVAALKRAIPGVRIHASTQMNIHSESGIAAAADLGVSRITLARELSLGEIARLARMAAEADMQVEVFAHGALCVCYSGQCFMSSMIGGRSANRGLCAQACRLNYDLMCDVGGRDGGSARKGDGGSINSDGKKLDAPGDFLLSPKDLCSIDLLQQLVDAGVASLKIEGRMKSPEYVQSVVSVYRDVLDRIPCAGGRGADGVTEAERSKLASAFSRGFTMAYLEGRRGNDIMSYQRPNNRGQFIGRVKWVREDSAGITCEQQLVPGDVIEIWTKRGRSAVTVGEDADCGVSFAVVPLDGKAKVYASDRVFRVRSVQAAFKDSEYEPRVPVIGSARLKLGEPLRATFRVAKPAEVDEGHPDAGAGRRIAQRLERSLEYPGASAVEAVAEGCEIEPARSKEVTAEDVRTHIDRLGSTPFALEHLDIQLDKGVGIGFSQLHHVRAEALEKLEERLLAPWRARNANDKVSNDKANDKVSGLMSSTLSSNAKSAARSSSQTEIAVVALASNPECAHAAKRAGAARIYVPALNYRRGMAEIQGRAIFDAAQTSYPKHCALVMPIVSHDAEGASREAKCGMDAWENITAANDLVVQGIGDMQRAAQLEARFEIGSHIPLVNSYAMEAAAAFGAVRVWLSPELNLAQIQDLANHCSLPLGIKVFGSQELMTTEHCMLASQGPCNEDCVTCARRAKSHYLKDRKGYEFPVVSDALGRSHIYNSVKLDATPELSQLVSAGVTFFMVDTTLMDAEEAAQAVGYCVHALHRAQEGEDGTKGAEAKGGKKGEGPNLAPSHKRMSNSTSGHLHRGVL